ncbi:MAG: hypothetical protein AABZ01_09670 [Gemmatimonadota bacterium]
MLLLAALVLIAAWFVLTFVLPLGLGIVHILLAVGLTLLIRWWALRDSPPSSR